MLADTGLVILRRARLRLMLSLFALAACEGTPPPTFGTADASLPDLGDTDSSIPFGSLEASEGCARPELGCPCDATEPVECVFDSRRIATGFRCTQGARYCRQGTWSDCESVREYDLFVPPTAIITSPSECNPCNPDCFSSVDRPDDSDLTPENSDNAVFDPGRGGITIEEGPPTMGMLDDRDGDGVPDIADDFPDDASRGTSGLYHTLPFGGPSETDPLDINARITTADIYFLMDTSGSMGGEIANLRAGLTSGTFIPGCPGGVVGAIQCTIPNAAFGVGRFEDYPVFPYGSAFSGDRPFEHTLDITTSLVAAQNAVNALFTRFGRDWPESHTQALWSAITGGGLPGYTTPRGGCPAGTFGYPCFRNDALPIIVLFTDATMHNGPFGNNYSAAVPGVSWNATIDALNAANARVIVVESSGGFDNGFNEAIALANATGTVNSAGQPLVFSIPTNGSGLTTAVVDAIDELANATRFDIQVRPQDNPGTGFDERQLVESIAAVGWGPGNCAALIADSAIQCSPGTNVDFVAEFRNDVVMPIATPQIFNFNLEVLIDGSVQDLIPVRIVVPAFERLFEPEARYSRTHDASESCEIPPDRPDWQDFSWEVTTPADTAVRFEFRTADSEAELDTATPVTITVPSLPQTGSIDVGQLLVANGQINFRPYLRTTAFLVATADRVAAPVLTRFEQVYNCVPSE